MRRVFRSAADPRLWFCAALAAALSGSIAASNVAANMSPVDDTAPLPTHPDLMTGTLPNGLTYVLKQHKQPEGRVALMLQIASGSLNERDDQLGLAHFMEHMAFNGSENFKPGEMVPFFEKHGLQFGRHQNAFTSFDQTAYILDMPKNDMDSVKDAMLCLSDMGFKALLLADEIDKERGIINEEARTGKNAEQRIFEKLWPRMMPGARLPNRLPIGKEEVFMVAPRQAFVDYYETWYRPELMTLYVFGDIDPEAVKSLIPDYFNLPAKRPSAPEEPSGIVPYESQQAFVVTDPEKRGCDVEMTYIGEPLPPTTTQGEFRQRQIEGMVTVMLSRRFDEMLSKGAAPFQNAGVQIQSLAKQLTLATVYSSCKPEDWQATAQALATEVKRATEHGFVEQELKDAVRDRLARAEAAIPREATVPAMGLIQVVSTEMRSGDTVMSAQQEFDVLKEVLPTVTIADVNAAMRRYVDPSRMAFVVTMAEGEQTSVPSEVEVLRSVRAALALPVDAYKKSTRPDELLTQKPKAGVIVSRDVAGDLGITTARLSNGVTVHHKFNDTRKNSVTVSISVAGGLIEETAANRGITEAALAGWNQTATSTLDSTVIADMLVGKNVSVNANDGQDSLTLSVSGTPADLETGLQLAYLMLTDPVIEQSAFDNWTKARLTALEGERFNPGMVLGRAAAAAMTDDPRRQPLTPENVKALTREGAEAWLKRVIANGAVEVAIVGEMQEADAMPLVQTYLGSLATRDSGGEAIRPLRQLVLKVTDGLTLDVTYDAQAQVAIGMAGFMSNDGDNITEKRLMQVASLVMTSRLIKVVREEKQLVYSIGARNTPADVYPGTGQFVAGAQCDPANAAELVTVTMEMFDEFAASGPTEDEIKVAVGQMIEQLENEVKEPQYWMSRLAKMELRGRSLEEFRGEAEFYRAVTADQVKAVFARYCIPARQIRVTVVPKS